MGINAIEGRSLYFRYNDDKPLFEGLNFKIKEQEWFGVIGPNGAGKSTLLKIVAGLLRPQKGNVLIFNQNLFALTNRERARLIGYLPQENYFLFDFTVEEVILTGRNPYLKRFSRITKKDLEIIQRAMELTDTLFLKKKKINQISLGEKQRVVLARVLAQEPQILLLDEVTAHLDINHQAEFINLLKRLKETKKLTVIFITHDLNLASITCERILLLDNGKYVACDVPEKIITENLIEKVYKIKPIIKTHPIYNKPLILP